MGNPFSSSLSCMNASFYIKAVIGGSALYHQNPFNTNGLGGSNQKVLDSLSFPMIGISH